MKYINADTVIQALRETIDRYKDSESFTRTVRAAENMILIIDRTPAADVVEVVRCKDCKWYQNGFCDKVDALLGLISDNDYCSYGERKETE